MSARSARSALAVAIALVAGLVPAMAANAATHHAPPAQAPTTFRVVAHLSTHFVRIHHSASIAGSVAPARAGQKVYLEQETRFRTWKTIDATKLNAGSEYSFTVTPIASGSKFYRVVKLRDRAIGRAVSPIRTLNATRWFSLDTLQFSQFDGFRFGTVTIDGVQLDLSISATLSGSGDSHTAEADLQRRCTAVKGTLGLDDISDTGSSAQITLGTDKTIQLDPTLALGDSQAFRLPVTGVSHLEVEVDNRADTIAFPAVGDAEALCAFELIH
jgi:hypothetical protein